MSQAFAPLESTPQLMDAATLRRTTLRLAHEIAERHSDLGDVVLVGVRTRGAPLAERLAVELAAMGRGAPQVAGLDIRGFRDDRPRSAALGAPALVSIDGETPHVEGRTVILVDDVIFTGRTLRAAIDALMHHGRAAAIEVLVLVDRGHRELPLRATYVGKNVPTSSGDRVTVQLREVDGVDGAWLVPGARR
ncbi:MAG: bifunctional pyr operon transcriptional regulator/uracil phosphoribosyltransferase PyrR [Candidatus Dormibacteraeota bacterium]|nr:bifunctional pyr operon transcriptional regulator/uracil phosphoribosyltransferase PyrR [Candidatus Dormibacteraeota bacterium]MBV9526096.1 bifunctional pyr operon transcriptional regulator/uracil phosphoribosyltransferase PyrR [Candidatus Dormibacteraeota bacterium]